MAVGTMFCALLSTACGFAFPKLTQLLIDEVIVHKRAGLLTPMILTLFGVFLLRDLFNSLRIRLNNNFEQNVIFDMRRDVYARLQRLPVNYFDQRASGDLMTRVIEDVNSVERVLIDGAEQGTVALLSVTGVLVILFCTNARLAWVALIPLPLLAAGALWYTLTAHRRYRAQRLASSAMNALLMDNLQGVRQIKAYGQQAHEDARFAQRADGLRQSTLGVMRVWAAYSPAMSFAAALGSGLVLWYGGRLVLAGAITLGELVGFLFFLALFYEPVGRLHGLNQMLQAARAAGERVFDILDATTETAAAKRTETLRPPVRGEVVCDEVAFSYRPDRVVLQNISLHARPGEMVALVGPTGAGKSTLLNLLPAFHQATAGRITIDGQDISRVSLESLRHSISVVSQEPFLFNGTGEKQRVSIARALLKNSPILLLDEATASVDTATERLIQEALARLMANRTSFVIAHRLSTIRKADQILVLREGRIVEQGTHEELLERAGLYAKLARIQNTTFIEESFDLISAG
jgi:ABC-type multidrug transport system fused ATPase/permease subunit